VALGCKMEPSGSYCQSCNSGHIETELRHVKSPLKNAIDDDKTTKTVFAKIAEVPKAAKDDEVELT
jgi:hypothetical protein